MKMIHYKKLFNEFGNKKFILSSCFFILFFGIRFVSASCPSGYECLPVGEHWQNYKYLSETAPDPAPYPSCPICYKRRPDCSSPNVCKTPSTYSAMMINPCPSPGQIQNGYCSGLQVCCSSSNSTQTQTTQTQTTAQTQTSKKIDETPPTTKDLKMKLEVGIPGFSGEKLVDGGLMGKFGSALYVYLLGLSGIVAVIILILAGFEWTMAGGNQNKIGQAKERIKNALTGLVLLACSHLILYTINPELVKIKELDIKPLKPKSVGRWDANATYDDLQKAVEDDIKCEDSTEASICGPLERICAPLLGDVNNKICQPVGGDGMKCDEESDCMPGLRCNTINKVFQCETPRIFNCERDDGRNVEDSARCLGILYPAQGSELSPGYCNNGVCYQCTKTYHSGCLRTMIEGITSNEVCAYGPAKICGQYENQEELTENRYWQAFISANPDYGLEAKATCNYVSIPDFSNSHRCAPEGDLTWAMIPSDIQQKILSGEIP